MRVLSNENNNILYVANYIRRKDESNLSLKRNLSLFYFGAG